MTRPGAKAVRVWTPAAQGPSGPPGRVAAGTTQTGGTTLVPLGMSAVPSTFHRANATGSQCIYQLQAPDPEGTVHAIAWVGGQYGAQIVAPTGGGYALVHPETGAWVSSYVYANIGDAYAWTYAADLKLYIPF